MQSWIILQQLKGAAVQEDYNARMELVSKQNNELHHIQEQLEELKQVLDARGNSLSDASPVVCVKGAIKNLNEEIKDMEVLMGLVSQSLLQLSIKDKGQEMTEVFKENGYHGFWHVHVSDGWICISLVPRSQSKQRKAHSSRRIGMQ